MKIRQGFVSNSSSSSFVCEVCGNEEITCDGIADVEMCRCENKHTFCNYHKLNDPDGEYSNKYRVPIIHCPICQFQRVAKDEAILYLYKITNIESLDKLKDIILSKFANYDEFVAFLRKSN